MDENKYTLGEHLTELRGRLLKSMLAILVTTFASLAFAPRIFDVAVQPLTGVLADRNRVDTVVMAPTPEERAEITKMVDGAKQARYRSAIAGLTELRQVIEDAAADKKPIDLVVISTRALPEGELATDVLAGLEAAPTVAYLAQGSLDTRRMLELMREGELLESPPKPAQLERALRRAASAAGKTRNADRLVVLSPLEVFFAYLKIALVCGLFLACPIWLFQAWRFVEPGLYPTEKKFVLPTIVSGSVLFLGGGAFAYYVMFPVMFDFLINEMMPSNLTGSFTVDNYLSLLLQMTVAFGAVFELPLAIILLSIVGLVTADGLRRWRKYWIIAAFLIGGVLTPTPDPISQVLMAAPLILFFEAGIIGASLVQKKRAERRAAEDAAEIGTAG